MRDYLLGILCAAFVCAVINAIGAGEKGTRRLLSGIFLALSLFKPLGSLELPEFSLEQFRDQASSAADFGAREAEEAKNEIITRSLTAYILTRAEDLGFSAEARIQLDPQGCPAGVTITAAASPAQRQSLIDTLSRELGIGREAFEWKDPYQSSE